MADDQIERIMMKLKREEQWQKPVLEKKERGGWISYMSGGCGLSWVGATRRKTESTIEIQWTGKLIGEKMRMSFPNTFSGK